ncbi:hypothetical protein Tco_1362514 [Tanacetum coccineum]
MSSLGENVLAAEAENRPPMLEKGRYDTWQSHFSDLTPKEKTRKECDIKVANIILHGLTNDIYTILNHKTKAYDIWHQVKELMEGIELTKQERESNLVDEFDRFTSDKGETIQSYYMRFVKGIKQARNLHDVNFDQLYAYFKQNEVNANEVYDMKARFPDPLALIANTYNPPLSYSSYPSQYNQQVQVAAPKQPYIPQPTYETHVVFQQPPALTNIITILVNLPIPTLYLPTDDRKD